MSKIKYLVLGTALSMSAFVSTSSQAADGAGLYTAKMCQTCHGAEGKAPIMGSYPKLAGQNKDYLVQQMKDIKSGARNNGMAMAMKAMVANVSEEEMAAIAEYLSQLK
ncbi:c-type cytochrome [Pseudoalteromonas xiamenensis]|uniref:c-type cytochrome n=1 Tax=Pseudoalteromonas xiamenensis TaxID=882626 RepID=UPI0027E47EC6|nr:c-type cytochrome [Pseudoalteromonas xiamenensis]WMN61124.1 c-type cytochrome [Pseudoalteromonas xiamenensis]